jgi:hypothetical protein
VHLSPVDRIYLMDRRVQVLTQQQRTIQGLRLDQDAIARAQVLYRG